MKYAKDFFINCVLLQGLLILITLGCSNDDNYVDPCVEENMYQTNSLLLTDTNGNKYTPFFSDNHYVHVLLPHDVDFCKIGVRSKNPQNRFMLQNGDIIKEGIVNISDFREPINLVEETISDTITKEIRIYDQPILMINTPNKRKPSVNPVL